MCAGTRTISSPYLPWTSAWVHFESIYAVKKKAPDVSMQRGREWKSGWEPYWKPYILTGSKHDNVIDIACPFPHVNVGYLSRKKKFSLRFYYTFKWREPRSKMKAGSRGACVEISWLSNSISERAALCNCKRARNETSARGHNILTRPRKKHAGTTSLQDREKNVI